MSGELANYQRGEYLLLQYRTYRQRATEQPLTVQASLAVLRILAFGLGNHDSFSEQDRELLDGAGPLLPCAVEHLTQSIREMQETAALQGYCVLFERFMNPTWTPLDDNDLLSKLRQDGVQMTLNEMKRYEMLGISLFSSLAFQTPEQSAMLYAEKMENTLNTKQEKES